MRAVKGQNITNVGYWPVWYIVCA